MRSDVKILLLALIEAWAIFAIILAGDAFLPSVDFLSIEPHPFWLPVLLISLQFGAAPGVLTALMAVVVTQYFSPLVQTLNENIFDFDIRFWTQPVLWLLSAIIVGSLRSKQLDEHKKLTMRISEMQKERIVIAKHNAMLERSIDALERQIVLTDASSNESLFQKLSILRDGYKTDWTDTEFAVTLGSLLDGDTLDGGEVVIFSKNQLGFRQIFANTQHPSFRENLPQMLKKQALDQVSSLAIRTGDEDNPAQLSTNLRKAWVIPLTTSFDGVVRGVMVIGSKTQQDWREQSHLTLLTLTMVCSAIAQSLAEKQRQPMQFPEAGE